MEITIEMIWQKLPLLRTHGEEFQKMANDLNTKYGLNVTVKLDATSFKRAPSVPKWSNNLTCLFL